ncbi:MAG: hypothetical protein ACXW3R_14835, partial [Rhodoplanes sp.]
SPRRRTGQARSMSQNTFPADYAWPDQATPERAGIWAADPSLSRLDALRVALQGRRAFDFYYMVAGTSKDPAIKAMAKEFVDEESEHVQILEAWITREEWEQKNPT